MKNRMKLKKWFKFEYVQNLFNREKHVKVIK